MANKDSYREIANLFDIAEGTCCCIIHNLGHIFCKYILGKVIKWPSDDEKEIIASTYEESKGFPGVIGMIDGCHIPIKQPKENGAVYYNRKDFYSVILQGTFSYNFLAYEKIKTFCLTIFISELSHTFL